MQLEREPTAEVSPVHAADYDSFIASLRPGEAASILTDWAKSDLNINAIYAFCERHTYGESIPPFSHPS